MYLTCRVMLRLPLVGRIVARAAKGSLAPSTTGNNHHFLKIFSSITIQFLSNICTVIDLLMLLLFLFMSISCLSSSGSCNYIRCVLLVIFSVWTVVRAASSMVEVFVDGKPVEVEPGTTVLQVRKMAQYFIIFMCPVSWRLFNDCSRPVKRLESRSPDSATMSACQWQEIAACVWWRLKKLPR